MASLHFDSYDAIIIDPDQNGRMKLKQVARAIPEFANVSAVSSLRDGLAQLQSDSNCDIIFIASTFDDQEVMAFYNSAVETNIGSVCSYIQVLKGSGQGQEDIARGMVTGMSGFLLEPYSVDSLREITGIATKIRIRETRKRVKIASRLVASTLVKEVDRLAALKALNETAEKSQAARSAIELIASISSDALDVYYDVLCDVFDQVPPPEAIEYDGNSQRLKERMTKKMKSSLAEKLEKELEESAGELATTKLPPKKVAKSK